VKLTHRFSVPGTVEETWERFQDIGSLAECFPGATVTSAEGDQFEGTVKVKLGPIALVYAGAGVFTEKDEAARRMVVEAKGKDKRGNGTAGADVTVTMAEGTAGSTDVEVHTDLTITGKPAQFGRGVMQDVSDKLLGQFVACLEQKSQAPAADEAPAEDPDAGAASVPSGAAAESGPDAADPDAGPASVPSGAAAGPRPVAEPAARPAPSPSSTAGSGATGSSGSSGGNDALDLGTMVVPVLLRTYGPQVAAGLGVVVLLWVVRKVLGRGR